MVVNYTSQDELVGLIEIRVNNQAIHFIDIDVELVLSPHFIMSLIIQHSEYLSLSYLVGQREHQNDAY
jgi:hypothetical protein